MDSPPNSAVHVVVRRAGAADAEAISSLLRDCFAEFEDLYTPTAFAATVLPASAVLTRMAHGPVWVAEAEASIVGTVSALHSGNLVTVRGMAVHASARGTGLARRLLDEIENFAGERRAMELDLFTTAFLRRAILLYEATGFRFTGEAMNPNGTELLRMAKKAAMDAA